MRIDWSPLDAALERHRPVLWWRDDDATEPSPALDRLLALAASVGAPVTLAAIPARVEVALARRLEEETSVAVAVHGWAHRNHAPEGEKTAEFGAHRPLAARMEEAKRGLRRVTDLFGGNALPVFVPPWNRLGADMPEALAAAGYRGLSVYGERAPHTAPLPRFDAHLDPVDWRGTRSAVDPAGFVGRLCDLVRSPVDRSGALLSLTSGGTPQRGGREGGFSISRDVPDGETPPHPGPLPPASGREREKTGAPIGLMTHHLAHDEAVWTLVETVVGRLTDRGARWAALPDFLTDPAA